MSNGDDPHIRHSHVKRIYPKDAIDPDTGKVTETGVFLDVLRIDSSFITYRGLPNNMTRAGDIYKFRWNDNPFNPNPRVDDPQQENANIKRKTHKLIVFNPDDAPQEDPEDPSAPLSGGQTFDSWWIVDKAQIQMRMGLQPGDYSGSTYQNVIFTFQNMPDTVSPTKRKVTSLKVVNNDLGAGSDSEEGSDAIDMDKLKIVDWATYRKALQAGTKDDTQKVYMEVIDKAPIRFGPDAPLGLRNQIIGYVFAPNKEIEELKDADQNLLFELAPDDVKTVRADPLQFIVNVGWNTLDFVTAGLDDTEDNGVIRFPTDKDVTDWETLPAPAKFTGMAFGNGMWIAVTGHAIYQSKDKMKTWKSVSSAKVDQVGFATVTQQDKPVALFVAVDTAEGRDTGGVEFYTSKDGTIWDQHNAPWNGGGSQGAAAATSLSVANGKFFIGVTAGGPVANDGSGDPSAWYYTTKDGLEWTQGGVAFGGLAGLDAWDSFSFGGYFYAGGDAEPVQEVIPLNVAYNPKTKTYAASGTYETNPTGPFLTTCFSSDEGQSWSNGQQFGDFTENPNNPFTQQTNYILNPPCNTIACGLNSSSETGAYIFVVPCTVIGTSTGHFSTLFPGVGSCTITTASESDAEFSQADMGVLTSNDGSNFSFKKIKGIPMATPLWGGGYIYNYCEFPFGPVGGGFCDCATAYDLTINAFPQPVNWGFATVGSFNVGWSPKVKKFLIHTRDSPDSQYVAQPPEDTNLLPGIQRGVPVGSIKQYFWTSDDGTSWEESLTLDGGSFDGNNTETPLTKQAASRTNYIALGPHPKKQDTPQQ